jgi:hypothetical protein
MRGVGIEAVQQRKRAKEMRAREDGPGERATDGLIPLSVLSLSFLPISTLVLQLALAAVAAHSESVLLHFTIVEPCLHSTESGRLLVSSSSQPLARERSELELALHLLQKKNEESWPQEAFEEGVFETE